jgi:DNA gyrase subunit A
MQRDTGGVRGMNVAQKGNEVIAMDVARDDDELLVVTENGYGKRTLMSDYPVKGRGTMGVKTIQLTEKKGGLAAGMIVREHQDLVFISQNGMVQRTPVKGISLYGRASQGVKVMNVRDDDTVSAVALVAEDSADTAAQVQDELEGDDVVTDAEVVPDDDVSGNGASPEAG